MLEIILIGKIPAGLDTSPNSCYWPSFATDSTVISKPANQPARFLHIFTLSNNTLNKAL